MGLREKLNNNSASTTAVALVVCVFCVGFVIYYQSSGAERGLDNQYYYDTNTQKVVSIDAEGDLPPLETDSEPASGQPAAVRAFIYACGSCGSYAGMSLAQVEESGAVMGMLQKWPDKLRQMAKNDNMDKFQGSPLNYRLVRSPDSEEWHKVASPKGRKLDRTDRPECEDGDRAMLCIP